MSSQTAPRFRRLALIGIGLIGSSISHAARRHGGLVNEIVGSSATGRTRSRALELGLVDASYATASEAVAGADLVIVCTPVGVCGRIAQEIGPHLEPGAIVSDVGSVKAAIVADMGPHLPAHAHFVPAHPIAGTEHSGPDSGFAELFDGRWCILTPPNGCADVPVARLRTFWEGLGSKVEIMTPEHHDLVLAITSHLPHLIAYNIVNTAEHLKRVTDQEVIAFSAGGFRDFTRIAASDPTMWRDIFLNNREAVLHMLGRFTEDIAVLERAIRDGDGDTLFRVFTEARAIRRGIVEAGQDTAAPDFGRGRPGSPAAKKTT
ncbi:MAG: prephenate/arogenate dehydrogenase family protein [Hyphomicrobiaceae bacterium]